MFICPDNVASVEAFRESEVGGVVRVKAKDLVNAWSNSRERQKRRDGSKGDEDSALRC